MISTDDCLRVIQAEMMTGTPVRHHIDSFNDMIRMGIHNIMSTYCISEIIEKGEHIKLLDSDKIQVSVDITNTTIQRPALNGLPMYPCDARRYNRSYSGAMYCDMVITATSYVADRSPVVVTDTVTSVYMGDIPIMIRSALCNTSGMTREELIAVGESPVDYGGDYILNGLSWSLNIMESTIFNMARIYADTGYNNEKARLEHISQPGDAYEHSTYVIITLLTSSALCIDIRHRMKDIPIPFFWLFKILGIPNDYEIMRLILYDFEGPVAKAIGQKLKECLFAKYKVDQKTYNIQKYAKVDEICLELAKAHPTLAKYANSQNPADNTRAISEIHKYVIEDLFPHISRTENRKVIRAPYQDRQKKAVFLGHLIRQLFKVAYKFVSNTDRDSAITKRYRPAGVAYAQAFRKQFVQVSNSIREEFRRQFTKMPFESVQLAPSVINAIRPQNFTSQLVQAITIGAKPGSKEGKASRLLSEQLSLKCHMGYFATLRKINVPNGTSHQNTDRASAMRAVHSTTIGYIDMIQSHDSGQNVGIHKQLAITASVTSSCDSAQLKSLLRGDDDIIVLDRLGKDVDYAMIEQCANIFVNGDWVGIVQKPHLFVAKYRAIRRDPDQVVLDRSVSICWDTRSNEIWFWVDCGRLVRPLFIVYNNYTEHMNGATFQQSLRVTSADVTGDINMGELQRRGIIEYISTDEQANCLIAASIQDFMIAAANPLIRYTHCEIHPCAFVGYPSLGVPCGNHNQNTRNAVYTNQDIKSAGYYALNHHTRYDKNVLYQYRVEQPIVKTIINNIVLPTGSHVMLAISCYMGNNQEDAILINRGSVERGVFDCAKITCEVDVCESSEQFGIPNYDNTNGMQRKKNYTTLGEKGFAPIGTLLRNGDAMIGKFSVNKAAVKGTKRFTDKTIFWKSISKNDLPVKVVDAYILTRPSGERECRIKILQSRPPHIGDKFTNRHGQKGVIGQIIDEAYMPYDEHGICPDIILNPHGFPTRMACAQLFEGLLTTVAVLLGGTIDATIFKEFDPNMLVEALIEKFGSAGDTNKILRNGMTGQRMNAKTYCVPFYVKRLKYQSLDDIYAVEKSRINIITRQGLEGGKASGGTSRIGEMELPCFMSHGGMSSFMEKWTSHSDGFDRYICRNCGTEATVVNNTVANIMRKCLRCASNADIVMLPKSGWAAKGFSQELACAGIGMRYTMSYPMFETQLPAITES